MSVRQLAESVRRGIRPLKRRCLALLGKELTFRPEITAATEFHGTEYGGWAILADSLRPDSAVLSFGVGEDASFDLSLIEKYGCDVHAFDPTPKSIDWVRASIRDERFRFAPFAIAAADAPLRLYLPARTDYVSASVRSGRGRSGQPIDVPGKRFVTLVQELSLSRVDLVKMDIEGAEYDVLPDILRAPPPLLPRQLLVEFHHFFREIGIEATRDAVAALRARNYRIAWVSPSHHELLFVLAAA